MRALGLLLAAAFAALLAGCRLDATVDVTMAPDGSGDVSLTVTVDADVVSQVSGLRGALQLPDATAGGWAVEGPSDTEDGGLRVTLRHPFATAEEATVLLRSIGPPFSQDLTITRTATDTEVAVAVTGTLALPGGTFDAFADAALVEAAGGLPFGSELAASGATPDSAMSVELALHLPGEITATTGEERDGAAVWDVDLSGTTTDVATTAVLRAGGGSSDGWAGGLAMIALVLLAVWLVLSAVLITKVLRARRRRSRRAQYVANRYR